MPNQIWIILITQFPSLFNFDSRYSSPLFPSKQSTKKKKLWLKKIRTLQSSKLSFQSLLSPSEMEKETLSHPLAWSHRANHGLRTFHPRWSQLDNVDPKWLDRIWIDPFLWVAPSTVPRRSRPRNQPLPSLQFCGFQRSSRAIIGLPDFRGISVISSPNTLEPNIFSVLAPPRDRLSR